MNQTLTVARILGVIAGILAILAIIGVGASFPLLAIAVLLLALAIVIA